MRIILINGIGQVLSILLFSLVVGILEWNFVEIRVR